MDLHDFFFFDASMALLQDRTKQFKKQNLSAPLFKGVAFVDIRADSLVSGGVCGLPSSLGGSGFDPTE